jgi:phosphatidylglycerol:prolipoprotein diacylglycerol transferase
VGAKTFAYAFDRDTQLMPPSASEWVAYYLDPRAGPKTLYGALLSIPLGVALSSPSATWTTFRARVDAWTAPTMLVLAFARLGCLLQGCCYGHVSDAWGWEFPAGSVVQLDQAKAGLIARHAAALPVVPTQVLEAAVCFVIAFIAWKRHRQGSTRHLFVSAVLSYSVARFALEWVRADPDRNQIGALSPSQWIAASLLLLGAAYALYARCRSARAVGAMEATRAHADPTP